MNPYTSDQQNLLENQLIQASNSQRAVIFSYRMENKMQTAILENWAGSVEYSEALVRSVISISRNHLEDLNCTQIKNDESYSNLWVDKVRSVHVKFECEKDAQKFSYLATLIPTGHRFLFFHMLVEQSFLSRADKPYYTLLKSFLGARVTNSMKNNLGVFVQVLVICSALILLRILKSSQDKH